MGVTVMRKYHDGVCLRVLRKDAARHLIRLKSRHLCEAKQNPNKLLSKHFTFNTYVVAKGDQHLRVVGVVRDLHQWDKGQVDLGETFAKVFGDKDTVARRS